MSDARQPVMPTYEGPCIANLVPELIKLAVGGSPAPWLPANLSHCKQMVLLVLDGLGWEQLQEHSALAPTIMSFEGGPITAVAPTSTPSGLTSIVTGRAPSIHGIAGFRLSVGDELLDVLNWRTAAGDARDHIKPEEFQLQPAFAANEVPVVTRRHFAGTGFTMAHLRGSKINGYTVLSSLPVEVWRLARSGEQFIYAYYNGLDAVAHAHGLGEHYDAELYTADRLVRDLVAGLPEGCALIVTSDHGQVHVGGRNVDLDADITELCTRYSGEGRFRWLHTWPDRVDDLANRCREQLGDLAWVMTKQQVSDSGMLGGPIDERVASRLGDVALIASEPVAFKDPTYDRELHMQCRHGSLTSAEMYVPLLATVVDRAG